LAIGGTKIKFDGYRACSHRPRWVALRPELSARLPVIGTTFSATAGGKKEVAFLFEDSTILAMPKPAMTPEDVEALTKAIQEMHAAEVDVQKAFLEQRPWEERDKAIKKARQTRYAWISLGAKFFMNWPV
jgi:hypothetical protein